MVCAATLPTPCGCDERTCQRPILRSACRHQPRNARVAFGVQAGAVRAGSTLFQSGAPAGSLYAIRKGMFKTVDADGRVLALHIPGEVLGKEAFSTDTYACNAVALQSSVCCELPVPLLGEYGARVP